MIGIKFDGGPHSELFLMNDGVHNNLFKINTKVEVLILFSNQPIKSLFPIQAY